MSPQHTGQLDSLRGKALLFECGDWIVALPAQHIERVGFAHELTLRPFEVDSSDKVTPLVGMTEDEGWERPTWDLGLLLGQDEQFESYTMISVPLPGENYNATLLGGRVLTFESMPRSILSSLPTTLFAHRAGSIGAGFPVNRVLPNFSAMDGRPGLWIDLRRLWTKGELALHEEFLMV